MATAGGGGARLGYRRPRSWLLHWPPNQTGADVSISANQLLTCYTRVDPCDSRHQPRRRSQYRSLPCEFWSFDGADPTGCADYGVFVASGSHPVLRVLERSDLNR